MSEKVACDWCCKMFVPEPDNFVETGFALEDGDQTEAWKNATNGISPDSITPHQFAEMREILPLNDEQLTELLKEGQIADGFGCICWDCLNKDS